MQSHNPTQSRELQWSHQIRLLLLDCKPVIPKANPKKEWHNVTEQALWMRNATVINSYLEQLATTQQLPGLHSDQSYHNFKIRNNDNKPSVLRSKTSATNNGTWKHPTEAPTINDHHQANCCWIAPFQIQTKSFDTYTAKLVCQISPTNNRDTIFSAFSKSHHHAGSTTPF